MQEKIKVLVKMHNVLYSGTIDLFRPSDDYLNQKRVVDDLCVIYNKSDYKNPKTEDLYLREDSICLDTEENRKKIINFFDSRIEFKKLEKKLEDEQSLLNLELRYELKTDLEKSFFENDRQSYLSRIA